MPNKITLRETSNNDLINCLISRHELYARLLDPEMLADAAEYQAELMRRLESNNTKEAAGAAT